MILFQQDGTSSYNVQQINNLLQGLIMSNLVGIFKKIMHMS